MSVLQQVTRGKIKGPKAILMHGVSGIGKSTWASEAPGVIFSGPERGTDQLDVSRLPQPLKWEDIFTHIKDLRNDQHNYKSLAIDSLDWLEPMLFKAVCDRYQVKSIELAAGGYGKGYIIALEEWLRLKDQLEDLRRNRDMNILLIAHSEVVTFADPQTQTTYQRYEMKLHKKASALWREYVDAVLFANWRTLHAKDSKVVADGARVVYTERRPGWDAKNRFSLPLELELNWSAFYEAATRDDHGTAEDIRDRIEGMLSAVSDEELIAKVVETVEKAGDNVAQLGAISNRLALRIGNQ